MRTPEILYALEKRGIKTTRQTLARYEAQGLIPQADRDNKGKSGRVADYPDSTVHEYYASNRLLSGKFGGDTIDWVLEKGQTLVYPGKTHHISDAKITHIPYQRNQSEKILMMVPPQLVSMARGIVLGREYIFAKQKSEGKMVENIWDIELDHGNKSWTWLISFLAWEWLHERERSEKHPNE